MEKQRNSALLGERLYINRLQNGLTCYIIPRKEYVAQSAMLCVNYGSVDARYRQDGREYAPPKGIAHFLEHKLFEDTQLNLFEEFTKQGASVNAYTNFQSTAYYFSCNDQFYDNLRLLLRLVTIPHFTDENVEKEKGIITQEISMYDDNPFWRGYVNMQRAMYAASPVRDSILGDAESVKRITTQDLHDVYGSFYHPTNMALICSGRFEREEVYKIARKAFVGVPAKVNVQRISECEPRGITQDFASIDMSMSKPMFSLGFKEDIKEDVDEADDAAAPRKIAAGKVLMDVLAGPSSSLFGELYREGLVDTPLSLECVAGRGFGQAVFGAVSAQPEETRERLLREIEATRRQGVDSARFDQVQSKHIGRFFRLFNGLDALCNLQADMFAATGGSADIFSLLEAYSSLRASDLDERLGELFREDNHVLSVVR
ncbi:MAG: insulinase family protein [Defluviitaleaceae bacterium]|nr:insulinase family protein [Defluviitaleaceae bacterium]